MEYTYLNTEKLVETLINKVIPSYTEEELSKMAFTFREKNWTSMGTYIYVKYSQFSKDQQDELRSLIEEKLGDKVNDMMSDYYDMLLEEIQTEWDLTEEMEDVEEGSDEYYEILDSIVGDTMSINNPTLHYQLMMIDLLEDYVSDLYKEGQDELEKQINEVVDGMGLVNDGGCIYNENDDNEENDFSYYLDFDYDIVEWVMYNNETDKVMKPEDLKNILKNLQVNFVD